MRNQFWGNMEELDLPGGPCKIRKEIFEIAIKPSAELDSPVVGVPAGVAAEWCTGLYLSLGGKLTSRVTGC